MTFKVPNFKNDHILYEHELYALGRLSADFFRWNCIAAKDFGFFAPRQSDLISDSDTWNEFYCQHDKLFISNLSVICSQGYPFIVKGEVAIEKVSSRNATLFAVANLAKDSESYDGHGYKIDFKWNLPEIEPSQNQDTEPFVIKLGQLSSNNNNNPVFEIEPLILQLIGTSKLWETVQILESNINKYIEQLITAVGENDIDCSEYLDRLERLNTYSQKTEVANFINLAKLTLKSAEGFYHRLILKKDKDNSGLKYQSCQKLQGRALEKELVKIHGLKIDSKLFSLINSLLDMTVENGHQQQNFIEKLSYLFSSSSYLFQRLLINRQEKFYSTSQKFDINRVLYRYNFQENERQGYNLAIEFNQEPTDVALIFSKEDTLQNTTKLIPLNKVSQQSNSDSNKRYKVNPTINIEPYLFIAAPANLILTVELIRK